jgi:hypothetical protein
MYLAKCFLAVEALIIGYACNSLEIAAHIAHPGLPDKEGNTRITLNIKLV